MVVNLWNYTAIIQFVTIHALIFMSPLCFQSNQTITYIPPFLGGSRLVAGLTLLISQTSYGLHYLYTDIRKNAWYPQPSSYSTTQQHQIM